MSMGQKPIRTKKDTNPFRYCGEYFDIETGFIYLRARYYDPTLGRFISEDPARDEINWYLYCNGNPVNASDPSRFLYEYDLSQGADTYMRYYSDLIDKAANDFQKCAAANDKAGMKKASDAMSANINKRQDIMAQNAKGTVNGKNLNVNTYNQYEIAPCDWTNNLCWATCGAMSISYQFGDDINRTLDIAIAVEADKMDNRGDYNLPRRWESTDYLSYILGLEPCRQQIQNRWKYKMQDVAYWVSMDIPFGVLYGNTDTEGNWSGHWVLGVGYASATGHEPLVVTNDPNMGVRRIQTYNEFVGNYVGDDVPWRPISSVAFQGVV